MAITRILSGIDVAPLMAQVRANPKLWAQDTLWTHGKPMSAIYEVQNIVLRFNRGPNWDQPAFDVLTEAAPIVNALVAQAGADLLGKVIISRLRPRQNIKPHIDHMPPGYERVFHTLQIPLSVQPGCVFGCGEDVVYMKPGNAYWFDNLKTHWVNNDSRAPRISMLMGVRLPSGPPPAV